MWKVAAKSEHIHLYFATYYAVALRSSLSESLGPLLKSLREELGGAGAEKAVNGLLTECERLGVRDLVQTVASGLVRDARGFNEQDAQQVSALDILAMCPCVDG